MDCAQGMFSLLPSEIIEHVAQFMSLEDLHCLRLTCKKIAEQTSHYMGRTNVAEISTNVSLLSIERLESLSRSAWAKYVKRLKLDWDEEAGRGLVWSRDASQSLVPDCQIIHDLCSAVQQFTNCRSIEMVEPEYDHDHQYPPSQHYLKLDRLGIADLVGIGLILIAECNLQLEKLYVHFGYICTVTKPQLQIEQISKPSFSEALCQLYELTVRIYAKHTNCNWVWELVSHAVRLKKLAIEFLAQGTTYSCVNIGLSQLQELSIKWRTITSENLMELLQQCRHTLRKIDLHQPRLDGDWTEIFRYLQSFEQLDTISFHVLKKANRRPLIFRLDEEKVGDFARSYGAKLQLGSAKSEVEGLSRVAKVDYRGCGVPQLLDILIGSMET